MDTVIIDGVKYVPLPTITTPQKQIIVADRGWVFVGDIEELDGGAVRIHNAYNIRRWGTTRGLGELVEGPLTDTQYDKYGVVQVDRPIARINVLEGWND